VSGRMLLRLRTAPVASQPHEPIFCSFSYFVQKLFKRGEAALLHLSPGLASAARHAPCDGDYFVLLKHFNVNSHDCVVAAEETGR